MTATKFILLTTAVAIGGAGALAQAQDSGSSATSTTQDRRDVLEEIVVTAERRVTDVQKTAISIAVISGAEITQRNLLNLGDVLQQTPAVVMQNTAEGETVFIRGVGSTANSMNGGDQAVNLNIDGVYQQDGAVPLTTAFDISRIEVLRGPQGTLYGRNANAGGINIITNDAVLNKYSGYVMGEYGNFDTIRTEATGNVPLGDTFAIRLAFASDRHDGYLSNGNNADNSIGGRVKLLYQPTDDLKLRLSADYGRNTGAPESTVPVVNPTNDPWYSNTVLGVQNVRTNNVYAQVDYTTPIGVLTLLPSVSHTNYYQDSELLVLGAAALYNTEAAKSGELRLTSLPESPIKWVGGLYYYTAVDDSERDPKISIVAPHNAFGITYPTLTPTQWTTDSYAIFGQATVPVTSRLRLTGGLRYTIDEKSESYANQPAPAVYLPGPTFSHTWDSFTFKVGTEYDIVPESMLYATISNGFKAGGFNNATLGGNNSSLDFGPEKILAYEIGSKNRFLKNRLQANLSAFYYDYTGYQAQVEVPDPSAAGGFSGATVNAANAKIWGVEAETVYALTHNDRINVSASYLSATYGYFAYETAAGLVDYTDEVLPNSPKFSGSFGFEHHFELPHGADISLNGNLRYSSSYLDSVDRGDASFQGSYTRSDASLAYTSANTKWNVRLFVRNIENKAQRLYTLAPLPSLASVEISDPRTYGVALSATF